MKKKIVPMTIILMLALAPAISAFGVSSPYWEDRPLIIEKGETKIVNLSLQNMVGEKDITVKAEIKKGADIISLKEDAFFVKAGTQDTTIPLEITVSKNAQEENRTIEIEFKKIEDNKEGLVIGTGMIISFDVIATDENPEENNVLPMMVIGLITIIILCMILRKIKF